MPSLPLKPCPGYGPRKGACPNLIKMSVKYCSECLVYYKANTKQYDKTRDQSDERQFLHTTQWRKIRKMKLAEFPLCENCLKNNRITPAVLVHHIDRNELNNKPDNLMSMCTACHEAEHKNERFGKDR
jgi:5-methylcytosine-specific restriction enzyme A